MIVWDWSRNASHTIITYLFIQGHQERTRAKVNRLVFFSCRKPFRDSGMVFYFGKWFWKWQRIFQKEFTIHADGERWRKPTLSHNTTSVSAAKIGPLLEQESRRISSSITNDISTRRTWRTIAQSTGGIIWSSYASTAITRCTLRHIHQRAAGSACLMTMVTRLES